jgi:FlaG protein
MSFEGLPRPFPRTDAMNPYLASNLAHAERMKTPMIKPLEADEAIKALEREPDNPHDKEDGDEDHSQGELLTEEELSDLHKMAKLRGIMDFSLETGTRFDFKLNPLTGMVTLVNCETGEVIMELDAEEVNRFAHKVTRYAGTLTDLNG